MTTTPRTLAVRTLTDLVELVPGLLGFHPEESLVVVVVRRKRVVLTARVDLPEGRVADVLPHLAPLWRRYPDATFVMIACSADAGLAWRVLGELDAALPGHHVTSVHADGARWHADPDDSGTADDAVSGVLAAEVAWRGVQVRRSRADLEALVEAAEPPAEVAAAVRRVAQRGTDTLVQEALLLVRRHDAGTTPITLEEAALLCLASQDQLFLDAVVLSTSADNSDTRRGLWVQAVRASPPGRAGGLLVLLGLAAWVCGQGALQSVCLERLQRLEGQGGLPAGRGWADLLDLVNLEAVPPDAWDGLRGAYLDGLDASAGRAS